MRTGVIFALLIAVCVLFTVHGSTAPVNAAPSSVVNGSDTVIEIQLQPDGDANISVETIVSLQGPNDTAGFEEAKKAYKVGEIEGSSIDAFRQAAAASSNESNRPMSIDEESIDKNAYKDGDIGIFVLEFTWRNFSNQITTENGTRRLKTDDSFTTADGTWLPELAANESLAIRGPEGYQVIRSQQEVQHIPGRYLVWSGPQSFEPGDLAITYASNRPHQSPTPTPGGLFGINLSDSVIGLSMFVALVALVSVGVFAFSRRDGLLRRVTTDGGMGVSGAKNEGRSLSTPDNDTNNNTDINGDQNVTSTDTDADTDTDSDVDSKSESDPESEAAIEDGIDVELLSDEERVERLLKERGGRMKQANIVRETDWSNAKVSQLLSSMDEDGRIEKLRIGRENLISLSDHGENDQNSS